MSAPYHTKALPQGSTLREWRLEEVLGVGGFGIVYRGRGNYFGEQVAIKEYFPSAISDRVAGETVKPTDSSSEEIYILGLEKFLEEAKLLWQLSQPERHPNIVSVRSLFEVNGTAYMVMDFESGKSLSAMLREGHKFDEASLMAILRPIAEGLDKAHVAGVTHRDIKPANILVAEDDRPVLIDFGSARFESGQATSTKVTFYTPPYAALEQYIKTYPQGPWTDIYALGVVLYQCVTGEKPPEVLERLHGGLGEALSAREWPGFSRPFTRAVDAAMGIRPDDRPKSIRAWLAMFDAPDTPDEADDDVTRVSATSSMEEVVARSAAAAAKRKAAPTAPAAAVIQPVADAKTAPAAKLRARAAVVLDWAKARPRAVGGTAAAVVVIGAAGLLLGRGPAQVSVPLPAAPAAKPNASFTPSVAAVLPEASSAPAERPKLAASALAAAAKVEQQARGLLSDSLEAGRPGAETSAISAGAARIAALAARARSAPDSPDGGRAMLSQISAQATATARAEAAALDSAAQVQAGQAARIMASLKDTPAGAAGVVVSTVGREQAQLAQAVATASRTSDPVQALRGARAAVAASRRLSEAYAGARPAYLSLKGATLAALVAEVRSMEGAITLAAQIPKPGLFASGHTKEAYRKLQDNAAKSRSQFAELEQLARSASATEDPDQIHAALVRGASIRQSMSLLRADSSASGSGGSSEAKSP